MNLITLSTDRWQIMVPTDWKQQGKQSGSDYFEAINGTKGAYLTTLGFPPSATSQSEAVRDLRSTHVKNLKLMPNRNWQVVDEREVVNGDTILSWVDCYDHATNYRICCLFLSQKGWSARVALHDYDCSDYAASVAYFKPVVDSLSLLKSH